MTKEIDLASMTPDEIIEKVQNNQIASYEYSTPGEYLKAMEMPCE